MPNVCSILYNLNMIQDVANVGIKSGIRYQMIFGVENILVILLKFMSLNSMNCI